MFDPKSLDLFSLSLAATLKAVTEQTEEAYAEAAEAAEALKAWEVAKSSSK